MRVFTLSTILLYAHSFTPPRSVPYFRGERTKLPFSFLPPPTSLPTTLLTVILHSALNRKAANPPLHAPPNTSSSPPYVFIVEGSSRPQIQAIVSGVKDDVRTWSLSYAEGGPTLGPAFPERLRGAGTVVPADDDDARQWEALLGMAPGGYIPGGLGQGTVTRTSGSVYDSGWVVLDYGGVVVHVMTGKSREFYDLDER